jgi:hypothetical protein
MTDHRDPIEQWLSRDVELLPPPQGTFQRVRRRARQRKAVQVISVAAGVAVLAAAGAALPRLASSLTQGTGPAKVASGSPSRATSSSAKPASRTPRPSASRHLPPLSSAGTGRLPPAGFRPTSVTFVQQGALGAVIGHGGQSCGPAPCTLVAGIRNYCGHWTQIAAPPAGPPAGASGVSQIRFADRQNGWAFGPALYATHNGGARWSEVTKVGGRVIDLSTVSGHVFAVGLAGCTGTGARYAAGCTSFTLYKAATTGNGWLPVTGGPGQVRPGGLQLTPTYGYLLAGGHLYSGPLSGGWTPVVASPASAVTPSCLGAARAPGLIAPTPDSSPNGGTLYLVCGITAGQRPTVYASGDGGRTWQARGTQGLPAGATATSLAVSPAGQKYGGQIVLATSAGIYFSAGARTWRRAAVDRQVTGGFGFVGMTTATNGVAVPVTSGLHEVFITRDGGRSWRRSLIR